MSPGRSSMADGLHPAPRDRAVVGVVTDRRVEDGVDLDTIRARYGEALQAVGLVPVYLPAGMPPEAVRAALNRLDGLVLTGASSNVAPARYGKPAAAFEQDPVRDTTVFAAIATARSLGLPILGICRGHQELNVAFGGTLYARLSDVGRFSPHTEDLSLPRDAQYIPWQTVRLIGGGQLASWFGTETLTVNSLHHQGIDRLGAGLIAEAVADDGVIEAISAPGEKALVLGVQWHPEWHHRTDPVSQVIYARFAAAVEARVAAKAVA